MGVEDDSFYPGDFGSSQSLARTKEAPEGRRIRGHELTKVGPWLLLNGERDMEK